MGAYNLGPSLLAVHADGDSVATFLRGYALCVQPNVYTFLLQNLADNIGNVFIFTSDQPRSHFDNGDLAAESAIHLRELQPDITPAHNQKVVRQKIHVHYR